MNVYTGPEAVIIRFIPPSSRGGAACIVKCPLCWATTRSGRPVVPRERSTHMHGLGRAGSDYRALLGDRRAHCHDRNAGGYVITDPDGLVPQRDGAAQPFADAEVSR